MKKIVKLTAWLIFGVVSTGVLVSKTDIQTPWQYTVESELATGSKVTLTQPDAKINVKGKSGVKWVFRARTCIVFAHSYLR